FSLCTLRYLHFFAVLQVMGKLQAQCWVPKTLPCDVSVERNKTKIIFDCQDRHLTQVPTGIAYNVTHLILSKNKINICKMSLQNLKNLTYLDLRWNYHQQGPTIISDGVFSSLTKLKSLLLDGNNLKMIPRDLPPGLNDLSLDSNSLFSVNNKELLNLPNIANISLRKNCYYRNPCNYSLDLGNIFANLSKLTMLLLSYNNLTKVPKDLPGNLEKLDLGSNKIQHIEESVFRHLTKLKYLDLSGNCPHCFNAPFPCVSCPNEGFISIHDNAFQNLTQLSVLDLSQNSLKRVKTAWFENCQNIKHLYLSFNQLMNEIAEAKFLSKIPKVEKIDLSFNYALKSYPQKIRLSTTFAQLYSLQVLDISGYVFQELGMNDLAPLFQLPKLSILNLATNFIRHADFAVLQKFKNLKIVCLSENRLSPEENNKSITHDIGYTNNIVVNQPQMSEYFKNSKLGFNEKNHILSNLVVKTKCSDYGKVLDLSLNNIFYIAPEQLKSFGDIACLNLSKNGISAALNGTEFTYLQRLKYMDFSFNKIDLAYDYAFSELKLLEVLDLSYNSHYFTAKGVTRKLTFISKLHHLKVLNMSYNEIFSLTDTEMKSRTLEELRFQGNRLDILWKEGDKRYVNLFKNLTSLKVLDLSFNKIKMIPTKVFFALPKTLTILNLHNNKLKYFQWENLKNLSIEVLNLHGNKLTHVTKDLGMLSETLRILDLSYNSIAELSDGFLEGAKNLHSLFLDYNQLTVINQSTFLSGSNNYLKVLSLKGNPFHCTCDLMDFLMWIDQSDVHIQRLATDVACSSPGEQKGRAIVTFDLYSCVNGSMSAILFVLWFVLVTLTLIVAFAKHLFYWDAWYFYHFFIARLKGYRALEHNNNTFDAFIAFDSKDPFVTDWVVNHLRVQLEDQGERLFITCLEERDWQPGVPVIDNLSQSIQRSGKTVFVLTENYIKSGNFKVAFYLAHQRLLDENVDVIVLILLEPVLQHSQFLRLRKRLCKNSVLKWPANPKAEVWFWQCLRNVIKVEEHVHKCYKMTIMFQFI
uniref:Toll like receptor 8 n=1 Tax=Erpetoichthys calabaricus TaxID=27687 RepID=A0A8C4SJB7_ERPCA